MGSIEIKGLKVEACHGVLESEKINPQPFIFDVELCLDINIAGRSDELGHTVNYSSVCGFIYSFCINNRFNLIETLAYRSALALAEEYTGLSSVKVTVHKPLAPVGYKIDDVCVSAYVERNTVLLSLGSSEGDRRELLDFAVERLNKVTGVKVEKVSDYIETAPYGGAAVNNFLNCAVRISALCTPQELLHAIHNIESEAGRVRKKRWADRTLDIDIIFFGSKIIAEEGLCIPHPDYMNREFVLIPLKQIAPDFVCPLTHRIIGDIKTGE